MNASTPIILDSDAFVPEIEQEVLGALLLGGDLRRVSGLVEDHHFLEPIHIGLFRAIKAAHERYQSGSVPVVARMIEPELAESMRSNMKMEPAAYLARLAANYFSGPAGLERAARGLVGQWVRLSIGREAALVADASKDPCCDAVALVRQAVQTFDDIVAETRGRTRRRTRISVADAAENAWRAAEEARQRGSGLTGITWGLADVNRLTGGLQRRDMTLIAARPSMGKSSIALGIALRAAKAGHGVGYLSLEMDADKLAARAVTDLAYDWRCKTAYVDLIRGNVSEQDAETLRSASREIDGLPLWIDDQSGVSMTNIRAKIDAMAEDAQAAGNPLGVVFIDHLGLVRASSRYSGQRVNEIGEMTSEAKSLAREYDIAVVLLSQLNRSVEQRDNKRPQLSDLRDSGAIEQDADMIAFLYRESYYLEREKGGSAEAQADRAEKLADCQNRLEFIIAKQRNGPLATVDLFADMACSAIRNGERRT